MKRNQCTLSRYQTTVSSRRSRNRFRRKRRWVRFSRFWLARFMSLGNRQVMDANFMGRGARRVPDAEIKRSACRDVSVRTPRRNIRHGYPWRLWKWHPSGRKFGFQEWRTP